MTLCPTLEIASLDLGSGFLLDAAANVLVAGPSPLLNGWLHMKSSHEMTRGSFHKWGNHLSPVMECGVSVAKARI
jgi:hypothetical protein